MSEIWATLRSREFWYGFTHPFGDGKALPPLWQKRKCGNDGLTDAEVADISRRIASSRAALLRRLAESERTDEEAS